MSSDAEKTTPMVPTERPLPRGSKPVYEAPTLTALGELASGMGQGFYCIGGSAAKICQQGNAASQCARGSDPAATGDCTAGKTAAGSACYLGVLATTYCSTGGAQS